jgi:Concanavalin A-like lectin/glucanases superfamily
MRALLAVTVLGLLALAPPAIAAQNGVWKFDNLKKIGGLVPKVEGHPMIISSPVGKAVLFNGKDDALFFYGRPLVGAKTFTIEAIYRPDGGDEQQRWMHIAETDPVTGMDANPGGTADPNPRHMFELRVKGDSWYLDGFVNFKGGSKALMFPDKTHPIGPWYAVAQVYDGKMFRTYVNGELQGEAAVDNYVPQGAGHMMVGTRMNHVNFFKGAIAEARFTDHALTPDQFLKAPK